MGHLSVHGGSLGGIMVSRAEPSRAEPSRAEPSRAEPSRAEPSRAEPSRAEPVLFAVSAPSWRGRRRPSASPPEPSAGRRFGAGRSASRSAPASVRAVAGVRHSVRSLRRGLLPALLCLPLLAGLATEASAQHSLSPSAAELYEGETRTFTVTFNTGALGLTPTVTVTGGTATSNTDYVLSNQQTITSAGINTGVRFDIAGTTDASTEGDETINIQAYIDADERFNFTITLKDGARPSPTVDSTSITEGETKSFTVSNIPLSWTGTPSLSVTTATGATGFNTCHSAVLAANPGWDYCYQSGTSGVTWNSGTRVATFQLQTNGDSVADNGETVTMRLTDAGNSSRTFSFTITINETGPVVTITGGSAVTEGGDATFTLAINPAPTANLRVDFTVSEETGDRQSFVTTGDYFVTVSANNTSRTFTVATVNDSTDEPAGSVTATLGARTGYSIGTPSSASVTVNDDDAPTLSIGIDGATSVPEGDSGTSTVDFPVTLSGPTVVGPVDFRVCFSGTATVDTDTNNDFPSGEDYQVFLGGTNQHGNCADGTINVRATTPQAVISIKRNTDTAVEPDETVIATLTLRGTSNPPDVSLGTATATFTILNDDAAGPTVSFPSGHYPVWEGDAAKVEVALSAPRRTDTTVRLHATPLTATGQGVDFVGQRHTVTIPRYETRGTGTIRTVQDGHKEDKEQFRLDILAQGLPAGVAVGAPSTAIVHIQDDDQDAGSVPRLQIARYGKYVPGQAGTGYAPVVEGTAAGFTVTVSTDWAAPEELTVSLDVSEDTGGGQDFVASGNEGARTMAIHPWRDGAAKVYQVPTANDGLAGPDGAVTVRLVPSDDYHVEVGRHWATVEVADDDHPRGLILTSSTPAFGGLTMPEGGGGGYTVRLASPPTGNVTVSVTRRDDGDGDGDWGNVSVSRTSLTFTPDDWHVPQGIDVLSQADAGHVNDRFSLVHTASGGGYGGVSGSMRVGVVDNPPPPSPAQSVPNDWALKPAGLAAGARFRLLFLTAGRTATASDIAAYNSFAQTEAAGGHAAIQSHSSQFKVVGSTSRISARDNTNTNGAGTGIPIHWLNGDKVADDYDDFWDGSWDAQMAGDTRGADGVAVPSALRHWTGTNTDGSVHPNPLGSANVSYGEWGSGTNPISNGTASGGGTRRMLALSPVFEVSAGTGGGLGDSVGSGDSTDNGEDGGSTGNTPKLADYSELKAKVRTWAEEQDSESDHAQRWMRVLAALGDEDAIRDGHSPMSAAEAQAHADKGWTRWDDVVTALTELESRAAAEAQAETEPEPEPVPDPELSLSAGPAVDEGASATFTVNADPAPQSDLTVGVAVAQSGDYLDAPGAGARTVTLAAGSATANLSVATVNDGTDEPDGSVSVSLNAGAGYTVSSSNGTATVAVRDDDEPMPEVSVSSGGEVTEGGSASFTVTASPAPASPLDVDVAVAQSGDFAASGQTGARTVTVPSSGSATLAVATVDDGTDEADGSVSVSIDAGSGYRVSSAYGAASVAVRDDDDPPPAPPCVSGTQWRTVEGYYKSNAGKAPNYGANWYRVLIAYRREHADRALPDWTGPTAEPTAAFTVKEAEDGEKAWSGWTPVRKVLECLRDAKVIGQSFVPLLPGSANPALEGVVRFVNRSPRVGSVRIQATDDAGWRPEPVTLAVAAGGSVELTTGDLERGNAAKGLDGAIGTGTGDWRLDVSSDLDLGVRPFARAADGATAAMRGVAEETDGAHAVWTFNPAGELAQSSLLRVMNLGAEPATARITGIDDAGLPGGTVALELPAYASVQLSAADLEGGGAGIHGMLGDGHGRWRLRVASAGELAVMNLAASPFGHLTNLSGGGFPALRSGRAHSVPYVPPASDGLGRLGLVRVINQSARGGEVHVLAHDAAGRRHGPLTLRLGPGGAAHFDSWELEFGAAGGGLSGGTGPGVGAWRLEVTSGLDIRVRAYVATPAGSLRTAREFVAGPGLLRDEVTFEEDR